LSIVWLVVGGWCLVVIDGHGVLEVVGQSWRLVVGCIFIDGWLLWMLVIHSWLFLADRWLLVVPIWLSVGGCWGLLVVVGLVVSRPFFLCWLFANNGECW
jgi:hypothetical protein